MSTLRSSLLLPALLLALSDRPKFGGRVSRSRTATSGSWPATASPPSTCTRTTSRRSATPAIPKLKFAFRNSGVGGHTIPTTLARFDYDIAAWKPTVVSVELGMNDQGGTPTDKFVANMGTMVERIRDDQGPAGDLRRQPGQQRRHHGQAAAATSGCTSTPIALKEFCAKEEHPLRRPVPRPGRRLGQEQAARSAWPTTRRRQAAGQRRHAGRRRAPAGVPGGPGEEPGQAGLDAGRPGPPRPARPADDGRRPAQGARRRRLRQQRDASTRPASSSRPRAARSTTSRPRTASCPSTGWTSACRSRSPTTPGPSCRSTRRSWT